MRVLVIDDEKPILEALNITRETSGNGMFWDDDGSIFETDIEKLAAAGITKGCNPPTNNKFCPDEHLTRDEMAAFLVRALNLTADNGTDFIDDDNSLHQGDIEAIAAAGITKGCNPPTNDRFCPNDNVTREQMAAFLVRALKAESEPPISGHAGSTIGADAVIGPATDGGYWLIGLARRRAAPDLFRGVRWSSEHALSDTAASLPAGYIVRQTDYLSDLDIADDLGLMRPFSLA